VKDGEKEARNPEDPALVTTKMEPPNKENLAGSCPVSPFLGKTTGITESPVPRRKHPINSESWRRKVGGYCQTNIFVGIGQFLLKERDGRNGPLSPEETFPGTAFYCLTGHVLT